MSVRHGRDCPNRCSMCIGSPVRKITFDGTQLLEDGKPTGRNLDHERVITARRRARK